jgi:hypothetical protein
MTWNYRVILNNDIYQIHEAYYNDAGEITAVTEDPIAPAGDTLEELTDDIEHYIQAVKHLVLKMNELKFAPFEERSSKKRRKKA